MSVKYFLIEQHRSPIQLIYFFLLRKLRVFKRGASPSFLISFPLSLEGEGDTGGEGDMITKGYN